MKLLLLMTYYSEATVRPHAVKLLVGGSNCRTIVCLKTTKQPCLSGSRHTHYNKAQDST